MIERRTFIATLSNGKKVKFRIGGILAGHQIIDVDFSNTYIPNESLVEYNFDVRWLRDILPMRAPTPNCFKHIKEKIEAFVEPS